MVPNGPSEAKRTKLQSDATLIEGFEASSEHLTSAEGLLSPTPENPQRLTLNSELSAKLERLSAWRLDETDIAVPESADGFTGGSATVFRAILISVRNSQLLKACKEDELGQGQAVAVKEMRIRTDEQADLEKALEAALREAEILAELSHPNVIDLGGFVANIDDCKIWLVFKWAKNGNLRDFVASANWAVPERISLIIDAVQGVEYLHTRSPPICHGDLKAVNILVGENGHALITDFGNARYMVSKGHAEETEQPCLDSMPGQQLPFEATFSRETGSLSITGNGYTTRWAAPEVLMHSRGGTRSDIWSLGWVFWEVMTGAIPFEGESNELVVLQRIVKGDLPSISSHARLALIKQLACFVTRCWNIDPRARPTAEELRTSTKWMPVSVPLFGNEGDGSCSERKTFGLLRTLGIMYHAQGEDEEAIAILKEALTLQSENITQHERANVLLHLNKMHRTRPDADRTDVIDTETESREARANALLGLAEAHRMFDEYGEAIDPYTEAAQLFAETGTKLWRAHALWGLAEAHRMLDKYAEAIDPYTEAAQLYAETGAKRERASALWGLAEAHRMLDEYADTIDPYTEAAQLFAEVGPREERANALLGLAEAYRMLDEYTEAIDSFTKAAQLYAQTGTKSKRACALWGLAEAHREQAEYAEAIDLFTEAAALFAETGTGTELWRAHALWGLAEAHREQAEYAEAINPYTEAAQLFAETGTKLWRAHALWGLAEVHREQAEYAEAIDPYTEAAQLYAETGPAEDTGRANALWGLATAHRSLGEYSKAIKPYAEAAQLYAETGTKRKRADALLGLAEAHRMLDEYTEAIDPYTEAVQLYAETGPNEERADALLGLAEAHRMLDKYAEAIDSFTEAAQLYGQTGTKRKTACALWGLADAHRMLDEYAEAIDLFAVAAQLFAETGNKLWRAHAMWGLAEAHRMLDEYAQAINPYTEAVQLYTETGSKVDRTNALLGLAQAHCRIHCHSLAFNTFDQLTVLYGELGMIAEAKHAAAQSLRCQNHLYDQLKSA